MPIDRYQQLILGTSGLVGYWRLGESSGSTAADSSGNGRDGTYTSGYTLRSSGLIASSTDKAATFDGTGYVQVTSSALAITSALTIVAWVKPSEAVDDEPIVHRYSALNGYTLQMASGGKVTMVISDGAVAFAVGTTAMSPGNSYMTAGTWDASNIRVYLNGVEEGSAAKAALTSSGTNLRIARRADGITGDSEYLAGVVDEVAIFNRALSASELLAIYNAGVAAGVPDQLTYIGDGSSLLGD